METGKITAQIKASVLRLAVCSQWCERTSWWQQAMTSYTHRPRRLMSSRPIHTPTLTRVNAWQRPLPRVAVLIKRM